MPEIEDAMSVMDIVEWPEKVLETKAEEVTQFDDKFKSFVADMHETMDAASGIGLAANQVGSLQRVMVIYIPWQESRYAEEQEPQETWHNKRFTFVNPVITKRSGRTKGQEGCLSFPEVFDFVERDDEIVVEAQDENGEKFVVEANGLFSVCIQHEIDHLDGVVFFERMSRLKQRNVKKKMMRRQKLVVDGGK